MIEAIGVCVAIVVISLVVTAIVALFKEYILPFLIAGWKRGRAYVRRGNAIAEQCSKCDWMFGRDNDWGAGTDHIWCWMFDGPQYPCAQQQLHDDDVEISTQGETNED